MSLQKWGNAKTFTELCKAMKYSLEKDLETPWHVTSESGGTDEETKPILQTLIDITKTNKMFTIEGQPGLCERYNTAPEYAQKQRAYTCGFIHNDIIDIFKQNIPKNISLFIYDFIYKKIDFINLENTPIDFTRYDNNKIIPLTMEYDSKNSDDMNKWCLQNYYTNFNISTFREQAEEELELSPQNMINIIEKEGHKFIFLIQHEICKADLNTEILNTLNSSINYLPSLQFGKTKKNKSIKLKRVNKKPTKRPVKKPTKRPVKKPTKRPVKKPTIKPVNKQQILKILSYNISWESTKPTNKGFGDIGDICIKDVSVCRNNIIKTIEICNADIVALQEFPKEWYYDFENYFSSKYKIHYIYDRVKYGNEGQLTMWNPNLVPINIYNDIFERGRPFTVIDFNKFTFINLHSGHNYKLHKYSDSLNKYIKNKQNVIICGDFNRHIESINFGLLKVINSNTKLNTFIGTNINKNGYNTIDHILTDLPFVNKTQICYNNWPASDHLPITTEIKLN